MEESLLYVIGPPRSGSTLLTRMLGAHPDVHAPAEPHLLTPLAHLGYYEKVDAAPYDPIITHLAHRELVGQLPGGEDDYLAAVRACTDSIYARLLEPSGRRWVLDKTPAYALILDFIARLYPGARYIVLTRNPLAVWSSAVQSFYDGDHEAAHRHNPLMERYVPAIARFLREKPVPLHHVRYEDLVSDPETRIREICEFVGLPFDPDMIDYGKKDGGAPKAAAGLGDPVTVARETRPTTASLARWTTDIAGDPAKIQQCREILGRLLDEDLRAWGYARAEIEEQLDGASAADGATPRRPFDRHAVQRKLLVRLRRNIHRNALGRLVRRIRWACDVLLR